MLLVRRWRLEYESTLGGLLHNRMVFDAMKLQLLSCRELLTAQRTDEQRGFFHGFLPLLDVRRATCNW